MNVNESSGNNDKKRYDINNSSYAGTISSNKSSIQQESLINEFNLSPNSVINNGSNSYNYSISNQNASQDINKLIDNLQKPRLEAIEIDINDNDNKILIFIKALGYNIAFIKTDINTRIGDLIEKYIKKNKLDEKLKDQFFFGDKYIDNLDKTIKEFEPSRLNIVTMKGS